LQFFDTLTHFRKIFYWVGKSPKENERKETPKKYETKPESQQPTPRTEVRNPTQSYEKPEEVEYRVVDTPFGKLFVRVVGMNAPENDKKNEEAKLKIPIDIQQKETMQTSSNPEGSTELTPETPEVDPNDLRSLWEDILKLYGVQFQSNNDKAEQKPQLKAAEPKKHEFKINVEGASKTIEDPKSENKSGEPVTHEVILNVTPQLSKEYPQTVEEHKSEVKGEELKSHEVKINVAPQTNEVASQSVEEFKPEEKNDAKNAEEKKSGSVEEDKQTTDENKSEREPNKEEVQPEVSNKGESNPVVEEALQAMLNMGFTDEGGWLTKLLETKHGNVTKALDVLQPAYTACN